MLSLCTQLGESQTNSFLVESLLAARSQLQKFGQNEVGSPIMIVLLLQYRCLEKCFEKIHTFIYGKKLKLHLLHFKARQGGFLGGTTLDAGPSAKFAAKVAANLALHFAVENGSLIF